jgi:hypothetical protein
VSTAQAALGVLLTNYPQSPGSSKLGLLVALLERVREEIEEIEGWWGENKRKRRGGEGGGGGGGEREREREREIPLGAQRAFSGLVS